MESTSPDERDVPEEGDGTPVCIKCFRPVNPLDNYCSNCGGATGNFTHYLPFINIRWQVSVWGQAWRQIWYKDISIPGRVFRFFMIVWNVPFLLIGLLFPSSHESEEEPCENGAELDSAEDRVSN
jgi:hypothetical protein